MSDKVKVLVTKNEMGKVPGNLANYIEDYMNDGYEISYVTSEFIIFMRYGEGSISISGQQELVISDEAWLEGVMNLDR